ncbi:sugar kinase [Yoonia sediminilitoris]|uniref:2-keto-3-deoxygluconate kinase n=1 Tax=Yoonia sediminilitoris TaxID=1286148 RepID=A0A2T6KB67_9RHOB|nr:sugar kinase [Yoonia sediminilitoris]PUB12112.1 2-keto-3-deoxygluconate kinase [Yoonia sediminilitoris]RCW92939.1 2-keto-3-deoxygluconate kinase [Yoonia sediminilitoris]
MTRFVSIGEAMVEMAPLAKSGQFQMSFAGDTLNTAWYVRQLKPLWDVSYVTAVGQDQMSDQMVSFLQDTGIDTQYIQRLNNRTVGLYLIALKNGERHFSYWRGQAAARALAADPGTLDRSFSNADVLYFSGITLAILEGNGRARLLRSLARARAAGKLVAFDSNLRPRLWESDDHMRDWVTKAAETSDIVLPSHDDEAVHFGDAGPKATCERYAALGATTVVVKNGPGTIHYRHAGKSGVMQPAIVSDVVDTTAAGDSFNAGFLSQFVGGVSIDLAIHAASNVARRVIKGRGALVPL